MSLVDLVAALMFVGVVAYALFGGADFGAGIWDLLAGNSSRGAPLRHMIDRSIGPVWEANHVWLIYVLVFLWTAFPTGFELLMEQLFVPWLLVTLGIVLRGGAFAFRKFASSMREARLHGVMFATSSLLTPFVLGMIAGALASGRVTPERTYGTWTAWTGPTSWIGGVLAVLTCGYLAGVFLAADSARSGDMSLASLIGRRALYWGVATGAVAIGAAIILEVDSPTVAGRLQSRGLPLIVGSALAGAVSLNQLHRGRWARARINAVLAVGAIVIGWGVGQYPDLASDSVSLADAAGARPTLIGLVIVFGAAAVTAVPALGWLFYLVNTSQWTSKESATHSGT